MPGVPNRPPYNRVEHAFAHLIQEDKLDREYEPWDQREEGEWALVYFHQTFKACLFPTLESVGRFYNWGIYCTNVFLTPDEFNRAHTTPHMTHLYQRLFGVLPADDLSGFSLAQACWAKLQATAERYPAKRLTVSNNTGDRDKYTIEVEKLRAANFIELPKQCRIIGEQLGIAGKVTYTDSELDAFARQLIITGKMKTKQDPSRVVMYYLPTLAKLGFLDYPTRRQPQETLDNDVSTSIEHGSADTKTLDDELTQPQAGLQAGL